ncbi:MAG: AAA family ATPase [bacterium]|nr:AAA family ATPase [bacterium]
MTEKTTWEKVKKLKSAHKPRFGNNDLMQKAIEVAEQIMKFDFVKAVGLFGSTARNEDGNDIDLLVLDNGTVSRVAFSNFVQNKEKYEGNYSSGGYAYACYAAFVNTFPGKEFSERVKSPLCGKLCNHPSVDLIFIDTQISHNLKYLNELVLAGNDPMFFKNISQDVLRFYSKERQFRKDENFPKFISNGIPGVVFTQEKRMNGFDAVGGQVKAKKEVMELSLALESPELYDKWGTRPVKGICLFGPPGNGKTLLARALADNTRAPFYYVKSSEIIDKWLGNSEKNIEALFAKARETGGIIFIDEADALAPSRSFYDISSEAKKVVDALCRNMDGLESFDNVVVFLATNRLKDIDPAILRSGRIDRIIEVPLPDCEGRKEIFEIHIRKAEEKAGRKLFEPLDVGASDIAEIVRMAEKIANRKVDALLDMDFILHQTDGYSGSDICEIIRRTLEAKVKEERLGKVPGLVTTRDIMKEVDLYEGR